jgi:hypothetical protein
MVEYIDRYARRTPSMGLCVEKGTLAALPFFSFVVELMSAAELLKPTVSGYRSRRNG